MFTKHKNNRCPNPECKHKILEPIIVNNLSTNPTRKYHGCSNCFFEIEVNLPILNNNSRKKEKIIKKDGLKSCNNFFGYLSNKPKDKSTPSECLVCIKLLECTLRSYQSS